MAKSEELLKAWGLILRINKLMEKFDHPERLSRHSEGELGTLICLKDEKNALLTLLAKKGKVPEKITIIRPVLAKVEIID